MKKYLSLYLLLLVGCGPFMTFQVPKTIPKGKIVTGVGYGIGFDAHTVNYDEYLPEMSMIGRYGLFKNCDIGIRYFPIFGIGGDLKYQLINKPCLSVSLGGAYIQGIDIPEGLGDFPELRYIKGFYPALLIGDDALYFGMKYNLWYKNYLDYDNYNEFTEIAKFPGLMIGSSFTFEAPGCLAGSWSAPKKRTKTTIIFEFNYYFMRDAAEDDYHPFIAVGFAILGWK
jgi:hypothetical protein